MARIDQVRSGEKTKRQYALDVLGHAGLGAAVSVAPIGGIVYLGGDGAFWISMAVGEPIAVAFGVWRERRQWKKTGYDPAKLHMEDRVWDVIHHILGPPIAWVLVTLALLPFSC